jgi:hypothetical protein
MQQRSGDGLIQRPEFYSIQTQWLHIINEYCKRTLTYESDTLPALSRRATSFCFRLPETCISLASGFLIFHVVSYGPPKTVSLLGPIKRRRGAGRHEIG